LEKFFYSFNDYLRDKFGQKVQRLSLNAGFTCPTRDGTLGREGCVYCNERGFSPFADTRLPLDRQIRQSMEFARKRYKATAFIAYFQNATNTYASIERLKKIYDVIRDFRDIVGLSISTRPDCIDEEKLDFIKSYCKDYDVWIEYGLQSAHDRTLRFVNRGHTFHDFVRAALMTAERGIKVGAHVIIGLPGETRPDIGFTAKKIAKLPVAGVKFHALHVLKDTIMQRYYQEGKVRLLTLREYVDVVCDFLELMKPDCVIHRLISDAREDMLIEPKWINKKSEVINRIRQEFKRRGTRQGSRWKKPKARKDVRASGGKR